MDENSFIELFSFIISISISSLLKKKRSEEINSYYNNPQVQGIGRLDSHSPLCSFTTSKLARSYVLQDKMSPYFKNLNGKWLFRLFTNPEQGLEWRADMIAGKFADSITKEVNMIQLISIPKPIYCNKGNNQFYYY